MKAIERECYALVQEVVVARDVSCMRHNCMKPSVCGHHLFKRDRMATAFLTDAIIGFCAEDHQWAHKHPRDCRELAIEILAERYFELERLSRTVCKNVDYKAIRDRLRAELKKLKEEPVF
jgi:hypothetical protein